MIIHNDTKELQPTRNALERSAKIYRKWLFIISISSAQALILQLPVFRKEGRDCRYRPRFAYLMEPTHRSGGGGILRDLEKGKDE